MTKASPLHRVPGSSRPRADVRGVNLETRRVALVTDWGYIVADICDGALHLRDVVEGEVDTVGTSTWTNLSTGQVVTVTITHVQTTMVAAGQLLQR